SERESGAAPQGASASPLSYLYCSSAATEKTSPTRQVHIWPTLSASRTFLRAEPRLASRARFGEPDLFASRATFCEPSQVWRAEQGLASRARLGEPSRVSGRIYGAPHNTTAYTALLA